MQQRHQVVVIGSGFGGLFATRALDGADVDVTLIDRTAQHVFQPLLYQVATGILSEGEIAPSTRNILRRQKNARTILGDVTRIDLDTRTVTSHALGAETVTRYDSLIVAAGAHTSYFGKDQFSDDAPGLKSVDDALQLRGRIFGAYELAELETDPAKRAEWLTFVVVGAGPTGVEMAGQIAELSHRALPGDFRSIDPTEAKIILIDGADAPLTTFGTKLSARAARQLERLGVELWLGNMVVDVDAVSIDVVDHNGHHTRIPSRTKVWSAGVVASSLAGQLAEQVGVELARGGRIPVEPDLTLRGHPEVFVVGDMIALDDLPGVAQVAIQGGRFAADTIKKRLQRRETERRFHYHDKGSMATISRFHAVASVGPIRLGGLIAWLMWLVVHLFYLVGFKNRLTTLFHWTVSFIGSDRSERTGSQLQVVGAMASRSLGIGVLDPPERAEHIEPAPDEAAAAHQPATDTEPTH